MFLKKIYWKVSEIYYRFKFAKLGCAPEIRLGTTVICGKKIVLGNNVKIGPQSIIAVYPFYSGVANPAAEEGGIELGDNFSATGILSIFCADHITVEQNVLCGRNVLITDNDHGMDAFDQSYTNQPLSSTPTYIGEGCWIGSNACVLKGTHIGAHSIIAAGSVVKGEIPEYSLVAGTPGKVVKKWNMSTRSWQRV